MLQTIFQNLRRLRPGPVPVPVALGRWCRTEKPLNDIKVDLANMDHCGTCDHEKVKKNETTPVSNETRSSK
jgi:hypothetical protein